MGILEPLSRRSIPTGRVIGVEPRPALLLAARGLPSVVLMRGLIAGALFGAEIYVPYLLIDEYGFSPTWAGLGLTAEAAGETH